MPQHAAKRYYDSSIIIVTAVSDINLKILLGKVLSKFDVLPHVSMGGWADSELLNFTILEYLVDDLSFLIEVVKIVVFNEVVLFSKFNLLLLNPCIILHKLLNLCAVTESKLLSMCVLFIFVKSKAKGKRVWQFPLLSELVRKRCRCLNTDKLYAEIIGLKRVINLHVHMDLWLQ